ncbi:hypothetical protein F2Q69_00053596 [Brassica cretica]|uniref:Uncharacterized protein n=1 Tax=Brassica cretica TaxID=69181 RepID=A0A8S9MPY8_BRACR|nr:hypothetical protein F2Q69_00053596 [Brassica cretica]
MSIVSSSAVVYFVAGEVSSGSVGGVTGVAVERARICQQCLPLPLSSPCQRREARDCPLPPPSAYSSASSGAALLRLLDLFTIQAN